MHVCVGWVSGTGMLGFMYANVYTHLCGCDGVGVVRVGWGCRRDRPPPLPGIKAHTQALDLSRALTPSGTFVDGRRWLWHCSRPRHACCTAAIATGQEFLLRVGGMPLV